MQTEVSHTAVIADLERRRAVLDRAIEALTAVDEGSEPQAGKRNLSPAARQRIAAAQRKRWAKFRKAKRTNGAKA